MCLGRRRDLVAGGIALHIAVLPRPLLQPDLRPPPGHSERRSKAEPVLHLRPSGTTANQAMHTVGLQDSLLLPDMRAHWEQNMRGCCQEHWPHPIQRNKKRPPG